MSEETNVTTTEERASRKVREGLVVFTSSLEHPTPIEPDRVYEYKILVGSTAISFKAGHRVRVEISSSNFPTFDRNSNSGKPLAEAGPADWLVATQTIFHEGRYPSHITLPIVPG